MPFPWHSVSCLLYTSPWCGYCRRIGAAYEKISEEYSNKNSGVYGMPDEIKNVYENICIIKKLDIEEFKLNSQTIMTNIMKNK